MFVFALCLVGTALALPTIPPAPILPLEGDVFISEPHVLMSYAGVPEFEPFRTLEFKIEPEPNEENKEEFELEKKEDEPREEEEPKKPIEELKPETVVPKPHFFIDWPSFLPSFSLPAAISSFFTGGIKFPSRILYPGVPGYVIVEETKH